MAYFKEKGQEDELIEAYLDTEMPEIDVFGVEVSDIEEEDTPAGENGEEEDDYYEEEESDEAEWAFLYNFKRYKRNNNTPACFYS